MLTTMRQIGNSRGVLIPAAFLQSCQIENQVDMSLQDGKIIIKRFKKMPREGWFSQAIEAEKSSSAAAELLEQAESQSWAQAPLTNDSDWQW